MSKSEMIPENVKMDLRSVLVAASGTCQSKLEREYKDMMGEILPVRKLGFNHIYELLLALEGEVCRMEYSPKHCDNMVFAVLEKDTFSSAHAKKNANKRFTGVPHKTPEEIQMLSGGLPPPSTNNKRNNRNNNNRSSGNRRFVAPNAAPLLPTPTKPMSLPTVSDWNKLNKLSCNNRGEFTLCGKVKNLFEADLKSLFKAFDPRYVRILRAKDGNRVGFVSFKCYMDAFIAWSHALINAKIVPLQIEPFADRDINWLNSSCKLLIKNIPFGNIHMVAVVSLLNKKQDLLIIETRINNREAVAYYKTKEAAQEIINASPRMTNLEGQVFALEYSIITDPPKHSLAGVRSQIDKNATGSGGGILPTPNQPPIESPSPVSEEASPLKEEVSSPAKVENKYGDRRCGFPLNFTAAEEMFGVTVRRSARTSRNVADEITFLVTHYEDGCRFWIIVIDQEKNNFTKLLNLQSELNVAAKKVQPPSMKPKRASRGAALYYDEDSQQEVWYRCFVLDEGEEESDTFSVFFIDYGNVETIKVEQFRNTYTEFWKLPPQAIPCKLNGVDIKRGLSASQQMEARKELMDILSGQDLLMAQVVKDAEYSQPHIVEVKNVRSAKTNDALNLDELCNLGLVCKIGDDVNNDDKENMEDSWNNIYDAPKQDDGDERTTRSMFQCDPNKLVFGMVSEIHNINLMYLLLGDFNNGIGQMESALHGINLFGKESPSIKKGMTLLYNEEDIRRRVLVLNVDEINKKSKILHVDYGHITWVNDNTLYPLDQNICKQPFQARPAALAGIKCHSQKEVSKFMKSYIKRLIRAHIVRENDSGKLFVELFDDETGKSLNLELLESGLVQAENLIDQEELFDETASLISVPKDGAPVGRTFDSRSFPTSGSSSSFSSRTDSEINAAMETLEDSDEKSANVKQWVESVATQEERNEHQNEGPYRPHTPPCPPPDIVSSNTVKSSVKLSDGVRIEGRKIYLGYGDDIDELNLNSENKLIASEVESLREKWRSEKELHEKVRGSLQDMLHLSPAELKEKFKEKRKEKLVLMVQMKKLQMELKKVESEYEKVVKETEALLAAV